MESKSRDVGGAVVYLGLALAFFAVAGLGAYYLTVPAYGTSLFITLKMGGGALTLSKHEAAYGMIPLGLVSGPALSVVALGRLRGPQQRPRP